MHVDGVKVEEYMYLQAVMIGRPIAMIPRTHQAANTVALGDVGSGLVYELWADFGSWVSDYIIIDSIVQDKRQPFPTMFMHASCMSSGPPHPTHTRRMTLGHLLGSGMHTNTGALEQSSE